MKLLFLLCTSIASLTPLFAAEENLSAPTEDCLELWQNYQAEVSKIIEGATAEIENEKAKLVEALKREQSRSNSKTTPQQQDAYQGFISYFQAGDNTSTDLFGNKTEPVAAKPARLPDPSLLPNVDSKRVQQFTAKTGLLVDLAIDKEQIAFIKKLAYQIKKTTRAKKLKLAVEIQDFSEAIQTQTPVKNALSSLLPQKTYPDYELYLSMDANSIATSKGGIELIDQSVHGQIVRVPKALKTVKGYRNEALRFDEKHALTLKMPEKLSTSDSVTLCAWIYIEDIPDASQRTIISHTHPNWEMQIENKRLFVEGSGSPSSSTQFENDTWYHVAWIYDAENKQQRVYVNGIVEAEKSAGKALQNDKSQDIVIGNRSGGNCGPWLGLMDEVYIFSRAISDEELAELAKL